MESRLRSMIDAALALLILTPGASLAQAPDAPPEEGGVGDELVDRALERTLVTEGGLLLPLWRVELESRLSYTFRGADSLEIVQVDDEATVASRRSQRDVWRSTLGFRLGLPGNAQAQLRVPYVFDREEIVIGGQEQPRRRESGLGDVELGLSKQLLYERRSGFDLLGDLLWSMKTGERDFGEGRATGSGFHGIRAGLTAVERRDPLVFAGTLSYTSFLEETYAGNDIRPGDIVGVQLIAFLAASPDASLRLGVDLSRSGETRIDGGEIPGSGQTIGVVELGGAFTLGLRTLLSLGVGVGVTDDASDVQVSLAVSYRLN